MDVMVRQGGCGILWKKILLSFELLTYPCIKIIKLAMHMTRLQNESIYIHKMHLLSDTCIVDIDTAKFQMHALFSIIFLAKSHVSVPFSQPFFSRIE